MRYDFTEFVLFMLTFGWMFVAVPRALKFGEGQRVLIGWGLVLVLGVGGSMAGILAIEALRKENAELRSELTTQDKAWREAVHPLFTPFGQNYAPPDEITRENTHILLRPCDVKERRQAGCSHWEKSKTSPVPMEAIVFLPIKME